MRHFGISSHLQKYHHHFLFDNLSNDQNCYIIDDATCSKTEHLKKKIILIMKDWKIYVEKLNNAF